MPITVMQEVRRMLARHVPFEHVEAFIEEQAHLDVEERAAIWLYAWVGADAPFIARELGWGPGEESLGLTEGLA